MVVYIVRLIDDRTIHGVFATIPLAQACVAGLAREVTGEDAPPEEWEWIWTVYEIVELPVQD